MTLPVTIALLLGDRFGIGPELVAKILVEPEIHQRTRLIVVGDQAVLEQARRTVGVDDRYESVPSLRSAKAANLGPLLLNRPIPEIATEPSGWVSAESGREVLEQLTYVVGCANVGLVDGVVYAPFNKQALKLGGMKQADELRFITHEIDFEGNVGEINVLGDLWTSRVTSHVPLRAVADLITGEKVLDAIRLVHDCVQQSGSASNGHPPKIAVSGLNPHAGDGDAFGDEEVRIIAPAFHKARGEGISADGPFSPDTVFVRAREEAYDAIVSMYHDQGQVAMKLLGFAQGVTLLGGLPFPVTTVGHGTAFDIAGQGIARDDALRAALDLCIRMAEFRIKMV